MEGDWTFSHFSESWKLEPYSVTQPRGEGVLEMKPKGLWLSVDGEDDWEAWCRDEEFGLGSLKYRFAVTLRPGAVVLSTPDEVLAFTEEYALDIDPVRDVYRASYHGSRFIHALDWYRVAADYPGIIIAPYQWSLRLEPETSWYYGWDCASGCIWDADLINGVERYVA